MMLLSTNVWQTTLELLELSSLWCQQLQLSLYFVSSVITADTCLNNIYICILYLSDPPSVTVTPLSQVVNMSDIVTITCTVFALPPPTITWTDDRNSSIVLPGGRFSITQSDSGNTRTSILSFNGILKDDESNYTCTAVNNVTNVIGAVEQGGSTVTVQGNLLYQFSLPTQSVSPSMCSACHGDTVNRSCLATLFWR